MLIHHPHIQKSHIRDGHDFRGRPTQTLIVETDLKLPKKKTYADTSADFEDLVDYLAHLTSSNSTKYTNLEIRPYMADKYLQKEKAVS